MATHHTAQGKVIDMAALMKKNEEVRAVSNLSLNARGDTIDAAGRVIESVTTKVGKQYKKSLDSAVADREVESAATRTLDKNQGSK
jgi:hypothetical protein